MERRKSTSKFDTDLQLWDKITKLISFIYSPVFIVIFLAIHLRGWGFIAGRDSSRRTVPTTHTQSTIARRNCTEVSIRRLASFDVRAFTDISPERSSHPTNPRATTILCDLRREIRRNMDKNRRNTNYGNGA
ncbi:hypothetical protein AVEN_11720-1 [Araneus ventricosus]|uniref:Transmembrane protein n=1 Tax=Araneus ventricosus TaxID=182803 RepID=A0A4Y2IHK9_ARAVE|nr:hypothetical protein AVEN_11720-1 [Araneus ventricosus]